MSISKMSLRLQIIIPLFVAIIGGVSFSMLTGYQASNSQRDLAKIASRALEVRSLSNMMAAEIVAVDKEVSQILSMTTFVPAETVKWRFSRHDILISSTLERLSANPLSEEIGEEIEKLNRAYGTWRDGLKVVLGLTASSSIPTTEMLLRKHDHVAEITKRVNELVAASAKSGTMNAIKSLDRVFQLELVASAIGGFIALLVCWFVARRIANPILTVTSTMDVLADGVTNIKLPDRVFASEINNMIDALEVFQRNAVELAEAHKEAEEARSIAHTMSLQDPLTNGPNRRVFVEHIEELTKVGATGIDSTGFDRFAVLLIDLDRFKPINDIYGHEIGDFVICQVAERLQAAIDSTGVVARLGGDEFGIVFSNNRIFDIRKAAEELSSQIVKLIESPIVKGSVRAEISASIGIAIYPDHGTDSQSLLRAADLAMYNVKKNGRASYSVFNPQLDKEMRATAKLESDTRQAVRKQIFVPHFQPIINMADNSIYGFEILARWPSENDGFIPPDRFIPIIEQFDLMNEFTESILRQACNAARNWPTNTKLALNISAGEVCDPTTPMRLMSILAECNFLPTRLEIEITETALVKNFDVAKSVISALRKAGIRISLDDFGTGYSSLGYLNELTVDCLKIDRSFIMSMNQSHQNENIVLSMLSLANSLGLDTVAEGVENAEAHERIHEGNGTFGQGYFYSKAVPAGEVDLLLVRRFDEQAIAG